MEKCIYLENLNPIYGNQLISLIVRLITRGRISCEIVTKYHYRELFLISKYLLECFDGFIFDIRTLTMVIYIIMEEVQIDIEDLKKEEFTESFLSPKINL